MIGRLGLSARSSGGDPVDDAVAVEVVRANEAAAAVPGVLRADFRNFLEERGVAYLDGRGRTVALEFFCPAGPGRQPGRLYRPGGVVGGRLSALVLGAGELVDRDQLERTVEVELPNGAGRTTHQLRVAGPAAYLATKADALRMRNKNKDADDVVWLLEAWPGALAGCRSRPTVLSRPVGGPAGESSGGDFFARVTFTGAWDPRLHLLLRRVSSKKDARIGTAS